MNIIRPHGLTLSDAPFAHTITVAAWIAGQWRPLTFKKDGDHFSLSSEGITGSPVTARFELEQVGDRYDFSLFAQATLLTRIRISVELPDAIDPFHLIPANIHGDNALDHAEPGHLPNLTTRHPENVSCSPYWEMRADRAAMPVSMCLFATNAGSGLAAVSVQPYSVSDAHHQTTNSDEGFIRNGVFAQLAHDDKPCACGVTLGYRNAPVTFLNKDQWLDATEHRSLSPIGSGSIYLRPMADRTDAHAVMRDLYEHHHEKPETPITQRETVEALLDAFLTVNWQEDRQHFSNMRCIDAYKNTLTAWRTLAEIGWSGGGVIGYPLMLAGHMLGNDLAVQRGTWLLDWIAKAYNPDSGMLWDVCGEREGKQVDWWWSGYIVKGAHGAYTNGSGVYYLLKGIEFARATLGQQRDEWLDTARKVLDTICDLQQDSGNFGYTYHVDRRGILDADGYAGVWFVPALALAHRITGEAKYLEAAKRGATFYHQPVRDLNAFGTPMDTFKAVDQEGNLGMVRGAQLLHEVTGEQRYLDMLEDAAHYEYLWRYGFRARPEFAPLKGSRFSSVGGSVTSTSNPHIHPMGIFITRELFYLADRTGSEYHRSRAQDGVDWSINIVSLYPDVAGYGKRGVLTERFCPSDGLTVETYPDGSRSSMWFSYNGWAAAAVLEGLAETM